MKNALLFLMVVGVAVLNAQDFEVKKYALGDMLDFPSSTIFAEEGDTVLWLQYKSTQDGSTVDRLLKYAHGEWSSQEWNFCVSCIRDMKQGPDGSVYIAATEEGVYKRVAGTWMQILEMEARGLGWLANGDMAIVNGEGLHIYNGTEVVALNNTEAPMILNLNDLAVDRTNDLYIVLPSKLYMHTDDGWVQKTELGAPMSIDVDSENRLWVSDNFGDISFYQEGVYGGGQYFNFGTNDLVVDNSDALWYADDVLIRNEGGVEKDIAVDELIDDGILINKLFVDHRNDIWVASNFKSGIAKVTYVGGSSRTQDVAVRPLSLLVNPVKDELILKVRTNSNGNGFVYIFSVSGALVTEDQIQLISGEQEAVIAVSDLPAGIYFARISLGEIEETIKFIKQ